MDPRIYFARTLTDDIKAVSTRFTVNDLEKENGVGMTVVCFSECAKLPVLGEIVTTEFPKLILTHYNKVDKEIELVEAFNDLKLYLQTTYGENFDITRQGVKIFIAIIDEQRVSAFVFHGRWLFSSVSDPSKLTRQVVLPSNVPEEKITLWGASFRVQEKNSLVFISDKLIDVMGEDEIITALASGDSLAEEILSSALKKMSTSEQQSDGILSVLVLNFGELNSAEILHSLDTQKCGIKAIGSTFIQLVHVALSVPVSDGNNQTHSKNMGPRIYFARTLTDEMSSFCARSSVKRFIVSEKDNVMGMTVICFSECTNSPILGKIINTEFPKLILAHYDKFDKEIDRVEALNHLKRHVRAMYGEIFDTKLEDVKIFIAIIDKQRASAFVFNGCWLHVSSDPSGIIRIVCTPQLISEDKITFGGANFSVLENNSFVFISDKLSHILEADEIRTALNSGDSPAEEILSSGLKKMGGSVEQSDQTVFVLKFGPLNSAESLISSGTQTRDIKLFGSTIIQQVYLALRVPVSDGNNQPLGDQNSKYQK